MPERRLPSDYLRLADERGYAQHFGGLYERLDLSPRDDRDDLAFLRCEGPVCGCSMAVIAHVAWAEAAPERRAQVLADVRPNMLLMERVLTDLAGLPIHAWVETGPGVTRARIWGAQMIEWNDSEGLPFAAIAGLMTARGM